MTEETWRPVPGLEDRYEVSTEGRVRSLVRHRVIQGYVGGGGYRVIRVDGRQRRVHHWVLETHVGPRPEGMLALHRNDVKLDNRVSNLYWGTYRDNGADAVRNGRCASARKTHCPRGHAYTPENTHRAGGARWCRACATLKSRARALQGSLDGLAGYGVPETMPTPTEAVRASRWVWRHPGGALEFDYGLADVVWGLDTMLILRDRHAPGAGLGVMA